MIIGYLNNTPKNEKTTSQQDVIEAYARKNNIVVDLFLTDSDIQNVLQNIQTQAHTLLISDISVLGASLQAITENIERLMTCKHTIISIQGDMRFEPNVITPEVIEGIRLAIRLRSALTSSMTLKTFKAKEATGWKHGRQFGSKNKNSIEKRHGAFIVRASAEGMSKSAIARTLRISPRSVYNILNTQELKNA